MALIDEVAGVCRRLAPLGWHTMMLRHGLDLTAADLEAELTKELPQIDRTISGFEDFAAEGRRGIEAGNPARSLLYHALASPNVVGPGDGTDALTGFPTLAELDLVENYVFGIQAPSLAELRARAQGALLAVVVFASEYRPAPETVQRKHADLCFSRTGVARVGTLAAYYDPAARGFQPFADDPHAIRVLPSRFSAYIAMQRRGDGPAYGPMQFELRRSQPERFQSTGPDTDRLFWVPLHKLFSGRECLAGHDLRVTLQATHVNEKIRRIHIELAKSGEQTWTEPDISAPPFSFTTGIAELSEDPSLGPGVVMPAVHPRVVEPASYQGEPLTFKVPQSRDTGLGPSLTIDSDEGFRHAPEYVHVRHSVAAGGAVSDLNDKPNVNQAVFAGGYNAQHYVDFTGDGWVRAVVPNLAVEMPRNIAAYSLVTAPDFYPNVDQRELFEWWVQRVPTAIRESLWMTAPLTLSDERVALNVSLGDVFRPEDETGTTIVSLVQPTPPAQMPLGVKATQRHAHLPDAAAGIFAPGWDTSRDNTNGVAHLSAYGLGSPFPEDAKLCAALSTFWPAVAPDAGRSFSVTFPTVAPMTDEEIAVSGDLPWDGVRGPLSVGNTVEFASFNHVDYVQEALDNKFSLALTGKVDTVEYESRVLAMARTYMAAGITGGRRSGWAVASFRTVVAGDPDLQTAQSQSGTTLQGQIYRVMLAQKGAGTPVQENHRKVRVSVTKKIDVFVGSLPRVLVQVDGGGWQQHVTP